MKPSRLDSPRGLKKKKKKKVAVLSAGGTQHVTRRGRGRGGAVMGVVVVGWRPREDGVSVGRGAAELEPPQVLGVDGFVTLQHFDGLVHGEPLPLTACRGKQSARQGLKKKKKGSWVLIREPELQNDSFSTDAFILLHGFLIRCIEAISSSDARSTTHGSHELQHVALLHVM